MTNIDGHFAKMLRGIFEEAAERRKVEINVIVEEVKQYVNELEAQRKRRILEMIDD